MDYQKDYRLLRPLDLDAAKRGEKICTQHLTDVTFRGALSTGKVVLIEFSDKSGGKRYADQVFMTPLAWVEGRPVYKGDVLYNTYFKCDVTITGGFKSENYIYTNRVDCCPLNPSGNSHINSLTWQKPKTKREGWVNCYTNGHECFMYGTKEQADIEAAISRVACVKVEWEE